MNVLNIGELRHKVILKEKNITNDNQEGLVDADFMEVGCAWVKLTPMGGELIRKKYGVTDEKVSIQMVSRPNSKIKEMNRAVWQEKEYEICYVATMFKDRYESLLRPV
jgi:hypothetical protein